MEFFRNLSIEKKLISIILFTCIFSLMLAGLAFIKFEINSFKEDIAGDNKRVAEVIAASVTTPLINNDKIFIEEVLSALSTEKTVVYAAIIKNKDQIFATYSAEDNKGNLDVSEFRGSKSFVYKFGKSFFSLYRPILVDGEKIGGIYIENSTNQQYSLIKDNIIILVNALILITIFAFFVSSKLQTMISRPILSLAKLADFVSHEKDYSVRAKKESNDEIGVLFDSFNDMMIQIQNRESDLQKAYEDLNKAQRLEPLGVLAGGIAHDFNNLITAIIGNVELAKQYINPNDEIYELIDDVEQASNQSKRLTEQLLTFAKGGNPIKELTSPIDLIQNSISFILRGSSFKCNYKFEDNLWNINVDKSQINQVLNNLIINGMHAMPDGGELEVGASNVELESGEVGDLIEGKYVKIYVKDFGIGIEAEHLLRIFDPYFTTKEKGSGLGLASTYSIIKKHDGHIGVKSKVGEGTNFYFYLPATDKDILGSDIKMDSNFEGKGKVLVMDDEELIRKIIEKQLTRIGYQVVTSIDGMEATDIYRDAFENNQSFDLVIADITVPGGIGGKELLRNLLEIDPNVVAIVSSGYSEDPIMAEYQKYGFKGCMKKPFNLTELSEVLDKVLSVT